MDTPTEQFVEQHRPMVEAIARRLRAQLELSCDFEDLTGWGFRGLLEAQRRFDPSKGAQFQTFAYYRVRGAIVDGIRATGYLPRRMHAALRAAEAADRVAEEAGSYRASHPEIRQDKTATAEALQQAMGRLAMAYEVATAETTEEEDHPLKHNPELQALDNERRQRVRRALSKLPERERALVAGFYLEGKRFDHVAEELGISKSWASRLHSKALDQLREALSEL